MTTDKITRPAAIAQRLNAATPGPWTPCLGSGHNECTALHFEGNEEHPMMKEMYEPDVALKPADMALLANLHSDLRWCLDVLQELREALEKQQKFICRTGCTITVLRVYHCNECDFARAALAKLNAEEGEKG